MDTPRLLIRQKLMDGRLPVEPLPRVWGGPASGETCAACDERAEKPQLVIEGETERGRVTFFHPGCFSAWDEERRVVAHELSARGFERNTTGQST